MRGASSRHLKSREVASATAEASSRVEAALALVTRLVEARSKLPVQTRDRRGRAEMLEELVGWLCEDVLDTTDYIEEACTLTAV